MMGTAGQPSTRTGAPTNPEHGTDGPQRPRGRAGRRMPRARRAPRSSSCGSARPSLRARSRFWTAPGVFAERSYCRRARVNGATALRHPTRGASPDDASPRTPRSSRRGTATGGGCVRVLAGSSCSSRSCARSGSSEVVIDVFAPGDARRLSASTSPSRLAGRQAPTVRMGRAWAAECGQAARGAWAAPRSRRGDSRWHPAPVATLSRAPRQ